MTREEAVNTILYHKHNVKEGSLIDQALDVAIHALRTDGDTISRQAAIDALCKMRCGCVLSSCPLTFEEDGTEECADVRCLMDLPSAHVWNKFSPDDERLKDHHFYLISHKNYDTPIKAKWHEEGYWTEPFTKETLYWRHDEDAWDNVSAWMYLPEKYKEESVMEEPSEARYPVYYAEKIRQLPSAQPDQSITEWQKDFKEYVNQLYILWDDYNRIMEYIDEVPSAQPDRKKGKWIDDTYCSICGWANEVESGFIGSVKGFNFCPNCGKEMEHD